MYKRDRRSCYTDCIIDKYADDTVLTGLITDNDEHYRQEIEFCAVVWKELPGIACREDTGDNYGLSQT